MLRHIFFFFCYTSSSSVSLDCITHSLFITIPRGNRLGNLGGDVPLGLWTLADYRVLTECDFTEHHSGHLSFALDGVLCLLLKCTGAVRACPIQPKKSIRLYVLGNERYFFQRSKWNSITFNIICYKQLVLYFLQSSQVKRTPQDSINELII